MAIHNLLAEQQPTNLVCMICLAMYGSGARIAGIVIMRELRVLVEYGKEAIVRVIRFEVVHGQVTYSSSGHRSVQVGVLLEQIPTMGFGVPGTTSKKPNGS